jgi:hypothetical protein
MGVEAEASAQLTRTTRVVQIITMGPVSDRQTRADRPAMNDAPAVPRLAEEKMPAAFRTHDLSRRWVSFEMAHSFADLGRVSGDADAEDPFAPVGVADLQEGSETTSSRPVPLLQIPQWMRGGRDFSAMPTSVAPGCGTNTYRPSGFLGTGAESRRLGFYSMMSSIACEYGIPVGLFDALIIRESNYQADIVSRKNAFGLTQLMPETAAGMGVNRFDAVENLRGGARYLRRQLDRFGQIHLALAAYNAGPGRVRNGLMPQIAETQAYVDNVLLNWRRIAGLPYAAPLRQVSLSSPRSVGPPRFVTVSAF